MGGIGRRVDRAWSDVAEAARHADPIRPNEIGVVVIVRVGVISLRIPLVLGGLVEVGIWKQAQTENAGRLAEIGADRQVRAVVERRAARADLHAGIFGLVLERIGRAIGAAHVEPEAEAFRIGAVGFSKHGSLTAPSHRQRESRSQRWPLQ